MELHRLDGLDASGIDNIDISDVQGTTSPVGSLSEQPEIAYEILDDNGNVVMYADLDENIYVIDGLGGFFKKIGKGLKKFTNKVIKPVVKTLNRFINPATILLRNGFLLAMKVNMMKVASKLRFGYLSEAQVRKKGGNIAKFAKMRKAIQKAERIYELAGGKKKNLKKAILKGKGNKDRIVPLAGIGLGNTRDNTEDDIYNDPFEKFIVEADPDVVEAFINNEIQIEGLGAIATGTAMAAASGAVASVAALVNKIGDVFGKANQVKQQAQTLFTKPKPFVVQPQTPQLPTFVNPKGQFPVQNFVNQSPSTQVSSSKSGNADSEKESFFQKHKTPLLIGAGVLVVGTGVAIAVRASKNKAKPISGIPRKKRKTPVKRKPLKRDELGRFVSSKKKSTRRIKNKTPTKLIPKALL